MSRGWLLCLRLLDVYGHSARRTHILEAPLAMSCAPTRYVEGLRMTRYKFELCVVAFLSLGMVK